MSTPSFIDMERILRLLRPISEGGFGEGDCEFITRCLKIKLPKVYNAVDALLAQGRLIKTIGGFRPNYNGEVRE